MRPLPTRFHFAGRAIAAVVCDVDGLLVDSESLYKCAWQETGAELGHPLRDEVFAAFIGVPEARCGELLLELFGADFPLAGFAAGWHARVERWAQHGMPRKPGVDALLAAMAAYDVPLAVATAATRHSLERNLRPLDVAGRFAAVVTADDVDRSKPDPQTYHAACRAIGSAPERTLALEDSNNGMRAAIAAGCVAVMVPDILPADEDVAAGATAICPDLDTVLACCAWVEPQGRLDLTLDNIR
ncbi:MAG: HAD family hydrolase [Planctomycetota bacterium]